MDNFLNAHLSWFEFLVMAILIVVAYFFTSRYRSYLKLLTGIHNLNLINGAYVIILIICFVLVNPVFHGLIVFVGLLLFYSVISSYFKGVIMITNSRIDIGDLIKIGEYKGKVSSLNIAGIKLLSHKNNLFIPYTLMAKEAVEKFKSGESRYLDLICSTQEDTPKNAIQVLEKTIFNFPFLEHGSSFEIGQVNDDYTVHLTLANEQFQNSLMNQLQKAGFSIQLNNSQ